MFDWDPAKNASTGGRHGISVEERWKSSMAQCFQGMTTTSMENLGKEATCSGLRSSAPRARDHRRFWLTLSETVIRLRLRIIETGLKLSATDSHY